VTWRAFFLSPLLSALKLWKTSLAKCRNAAESSAKAAGPATDGDSTHVRVHSNVTQGGPQQPDDFIDVLQLSQLTREELIRLLFYEQVAARAKAKSSGV
jgi:hypothetical protein